MKILKLYSYFIIILSIGFAINSCEESTAPSTPVIMMKKLTSPTNLKSLAFDFQSVTIQWTASTDENNANFKGYEILCDNEVVTNTTVLSSNSLRINGLAMSEHTIKIRSLSSDTSEISHSDYASEIKVVNIFKLVAPTNLMATSYDEKSVIIKWTPSADEPDVNFKGYEIMADGVVHSISFIPLYTFTITGLSAGEHTFTVRALSADTTKKEHSVVATIKWAPAWRFIKDINEAPIRVSETASIFGSGLNIFDIDGGAPEQLKLAFIEEWTLGLETKTAGDINFGPAASLTNYASIMTGKTMKNVEISAPIVAASLNEVFDSQALSAKTFSPALVELNSINAAKSVVFVVREKIGTNYRYAKVLVKKTAAGFLQGTAPERYLEMEVSYQRIPDLPYAKTI